ncbi:MAG TPA: flagellar basal-body MS-ring/collar protein FliF [Burkholderiaceae bacterium]|nr:flagellar basal-body MS-ring/collar protein FliF [Burkholderiaceae bacterium]
MDNALTPALLPANARPPDGLMGRLTAVPVKAMVMLTLGVAALAAVIAALAMWSKSGDYRVLYANLSDKDGGAILAQLSQMNVPYQHADGGSAILVPADKVHDVRLRLAQAGLPKGSTAGFELLDNARFGQTQFQERMTWQRALEGELVRSISALSAVQSARVHLALPQQNGFFREQQKPSASVLVQLHPGRTLDRAQIAGIVHLVSSSVPELTPKAVSVLDSSGTLLSGASGDGPASGLDAQQLQYVQQIEASYVKRVIEIIEPIVGRDNVRATVTADVDFAQSEATDELFKPNQGRDAAATVRSQQMSESSNGPSSTPSGIPGALSNQPPVPATAPLTGASAPLHTAGSNAGGSGSTRRDNVVNYEVDKTVRVTRNATGIVKRLNAAVVVNHRVLTDAKGKTTSTPLSSDEVDKLTALVQESIGFSKERGDSVKLINAPFRTEAMPKAADALPLWQQPWLLDLVRAAAVPAALVLVALLVIGGVIKPALKAAAGPTVGRQLDAVVADTPNMQSPPAAPLALGAPNTGKQLTDAREMAKQNPAAVAHIVRGWVGNDGG